MGLLSILTGIADVISNDINTPESFKQGQKFENYVEEYLFPNSYYDVLEKTHSYQTNSKSYVESSLNPDFKFRDRYTKKEFYVEAKFRTNVYKNKLVWCNDKQLARYQDINKRISVFLILGDGGKADWPEYLSLIPISKAKYTGLFPSFVDQFEIEPEKAITSKILWNR
ncbi:MAG TPA: hypothetical protein VK668_20645 [Mucilaginibacter sp.]|nr:hypothetical protein [Mucilaginibacter sp.]